MGMTLAQESGTLAQVSCIKKIMQVPETFKTLA